MKKVLLATTAAAGVAVAGAAHAEAPTLSLSGGIEYAYHFYDNDDTGTSLGHGVHQDNTNSQIFFDAKGVADNGLEYGMRFDFRMNATSDESYIYFADSWGRLHFGDDDGVVANMTYGGEKALAGTGGYDGDAADYWSAATFAVSSPSTVGGTDDASKIAYYSPSFAGFQFGASFTPERTFTGSTGPNTNASSTKAAFPVRTIQNVVDVAAAYTGNFDAVTIGLNAGYRNASSTSETIIEDVSVFEVGGMVGFGGFTVAAGYGDNGDSFCPTALAGCDAGFYWDVGVGYAAGPFKVGAGYFASEATPAAGVTDNEVEIWTVGANYTIAQGLTAFAEYNDGTISPSVVNGAAVNDVEQQSFILGTRMSF